jgi:uncharacterized protein (DUF4213/DUF364 family)
MVSALPHWIAEQGATSAEVSYQPGTILQETVLRIRETLGSAVENVTVERVVLGLFFTGVKLSDGTGGLCFTPIKAIPEAVCCPSSAKAMPMSGRLIGRQAISFVEGMFSGNPLKKAIGIAAMNALSMGCWRVKPPEHYTIRSRTDAMDVAEIRESDYAVVVGALVPALRELKRRGKPFGILELDKTTLKPDELPFHIGPQQADEAVSRADLMIITGTTLINDTLEGLLKQRKPGARVVVMGPTASGLPEAFFQRGVSAIGGVMVDNPDRVLDLIAEGGSGYHFFEKGAERIVIQVPAS